MARAKKEEETPSQKKKRLAAEAKAETRAARKETAPEAEAKAADAPDNMSKGRWAKIFASAAFKGLQKDHGDLILTAASDARVAKSFRIPSGIFPLDLALGGGWPQGRINTVFGMKSAGKTYTLLRTIASAQKMCSNCWTFVEWSKEVEREEEKLDETTGEVTKTGKMKKYWDVSPIERWDGADDKFIEMVPTVVEKDGTLVKVWAAGVRVKPKCSCGKYRETVCAFIDVEGTFDKPWATRLGVNLDKLLLSQPEYAEQSLDIGDALVRSGNCDVLVLDSIAFLTPQKEIEESSEKDLMGAQPRVVGKGTRKFISGINGVALDSERRPTIFLTNQIRMKLGVMFGNPETQPGGLAPGFAAATEVRMRPGKFEFESEKDAEGATPRPLWSDIPFDVEKNKSAVPKVGGTIRLMMMDTATHKLGEVYDQDMVMVEAQKVGLVRKEEKAWLCMGEEYKTKGEIEEKLLKDGIFSHRLRSALFKVMTMAESGMELLPPPDESSEETPET
jgi:protein RecA